mgnify:CR=1 FL=1
MSKNYKEFQATPVDDKIHLWHIMRLHKLNTFLDGNLWFARLDQFNTNYEGEVPVSNIGLLIRLLRNQSGSVLAEYENFAQKAYASCWHMNYGDPNNKMWDSFKGEVAIKTSPSIIKELVNSVPKHKNGGPIYFSKVDYIDYANEYIPDTNMLYASFTVTEQFEANEQEARILISTDSIPMSHQIFRYRNDLQTAILLPIVPENFIEEILIRDSLTDSRSNVIRHAIEQKGLGHKIRT